MFADRQATAMIPAGDIARATKWYEEKLGIKPASQDEYGVHYRLGGGLKAFMYPTQFAGTAGHTLFAFNCDDLVADMKTLRGKGVVFEDYDLPGLKTENGMVTYGPVKNAWAKDSEGNIIAFVEGM